MSTTATLGSSGHTVRGYRRQEGQSMHFVQMEIHKNSRYIRASSIHLKVENNGYLWRSFITAKHVAFELWRTDDMQLLSI